MNLTHRYPIAIDMSCPEEISAMQLAMKGGLPHVRAMRQQISTSEAGIPAESDRIAFIREVLSSSAFKGRSVALLPPLDMILCYPLRVELGKEEALEAGIIREAAGALGFPLEEAVLDYASVLPDPGGKRNINEVLAVAARSSDVDRCIRLVQDSGGSLEILESAATALVRVHSAAAKQSAGPALLCNVGRQRSEIVVIHGAGIVAHRNVNWGTNELRRTLVDNLALEGGDRDADFLIHSQGLADTASATGVDGGAQSAETPLGSIAQLLSPQVNAFTHELHSITGYVRSRIADAAFAGIFLYGDGASVRDLDRYIQEELGMSAKAVDPFQAAGVSYAGDLQDIANSRSYALALGLALRRSQWL